MTAFLAALGGRLADKWVSLLVLPGFLFMTLVAVAGQLGHAHALDTARLVHRLDTLAAEPAARTPGTVALVLALVLAASAGAGLLAATVAGWVERWWLGDWPFATRIGERLSRRRRAKWERADRLCAQERQRLVGAAESAEARTRESATALGPGPAAAADAPGHPAEPASADLLPLTRLYEARNRIALTRPAHPTWMADRMAAAESRLRRAYAVDLPTAWPRLWLLLPDVPRDDLRSARAELTTAARRAAWGVLCLVLAVWWWPAAAVALVMTGSARRSGRQSADAFAALVESAMDVYGRELARALGLSDEAEFSRATGVRITRITRKGE
ncbi:hypothetical protein [Streptomyces sp. NP-1717]|uniref:hypothetical protein n=1 Tax=Streptomyces sp. NP-1717 TaxID=2704470 RepID=UPI001F5DC44E|nr:hypothetical protein [Streptomyces sp. NP-1717]MCI3224306.1 hypothetical protein [Streptomyces sp. NP-1717]